MRETIWVTNLLTKCQLKNLIWALRCFRQKARWTKISDQKRLLISVFTVHQFLKWVLRIIFKINREFARQTLAFSKIKKTSTVWMDSTIKTLLKNSKNITIRQFKLLYLSKRLIKESKYTIKWRKLIASGLQYSPKIKFKSQIPQTLGKKIG